MSKITRVSPRRSGELRFGRKSSAWKPKLSEYTLTPEQMQRYLNGEKMEDILREGNAVSEPRVISYQKYKQLENAHNQLKKEYEQLSEKKQDPASAVNGNENEMDNLRREVIDAHKLVSDLEQKLEKTEEQYNNAASANKQLQKENTLLENEVHGLRQEIKRAEEQNNQFFSGCISQEQEIKALRLYAFEKLKKDVHGA